MQDRDQTFEAWIIQNSPRKQLMILQFGRQHITDSQGYETSILSSMAKVFIPIGHAQKHSYCQCVPLGHAQRKSCSQSREKYPLIGNF